MKKKIRKAVSVILASAMVLSVPFSLAGCGKEEEPEDTVTTISVTAEELAPEITDEDLGIVRKDPKELLKITGYQSWEGYHFLVLSGYGNTARTTVQVEDEELFDALYDARLKVLLDVSYASVDQDDPMYGAYAKGLRSLGENFYSLEEQEKETAEDTADTEKPEIDTMLPEEDTAVAQVPETSDGTEESAEDTEDADDTGEGSAAAEAGQDTADETSGSAENTEDGQDMETSAQEDGSFDEDLDTLEFQTREEAENGGLQDKNNAEAVMAQGKKAEEELKTAIAEYMQSVSLNRATQILVYALDGELLGEMTAQKVIDYAAAFETEPENYQPQNGVIYTSDLEDGVEYNVEGTVNSDTDFIYTIKNDTREPVIIHAASETSQKDEYIFKNYLTTSKSSGWYLVENEYSFTSTDDHYRIMIEYRNADADMIRELPEDSVLVIDQITDDVDTVESVYQAIYNSTDQEIYIEADTGDAYVLGSKQAVGVHKSAYDSLELYFEGAKGNHEDESLPEEQGTQDEDSVPEEENTAE